MLTYLATKNRSSLRRLATLLIVGGVALHATRLFSQSFPQPATFSLGAKGSSLGYSAAVLNGEIWVGGTDSNTRNILLTHSPSGYGLPAMSTPTSLMNSTSQQVSMTSFNGLIFLAHAALNGSTNVAISPNNGLDWMSYVVLTAEPGGLSPTNSQLAPAITTFQGRLRLCFIDRSNGLAYVTTSADGRNWSARTLVGTYVAGQNVGQGPSITGTTIGGRAALVVALVGSDKHLWVGSSYDGANFTDSAAYSVRINLSTRPVITGYRGSGILLHYVSDDQFRVILQINSANVYGFGVVATTFKNLASGTPPSLQTLSTPSVNGGALTTFEIFGSNDPQHTIGTTSTQ